METFFPLCGKLFPLCGKLCGRARKIRLRYGFGRGGGSGALLVQHQQGSEEVIVGQVGLPAVGGEDGGVECAVGILKPIGFIVECRQRPCLVQTIIRPVFPHLIQFLAASAITNSYAGRRLARERGSDPRRENHAGVVQN